MLHLTSAECSNCYRESSVCNSHWVSHKKLGSKIAWKVKQTKAIPCGIFRVQTVSQSVLHLTVHCSNAPYTLLYSDICTNLEN